MMADPDCATIRPADRARPEETPMPIPKQPFEPDRQGPLRGVRVLDFSRLVAGNMLSLQLADLGAEVVKVEAPGRGDTLRARRDGKLPVCCRSVGAIAGFPSRNGFEDREPVLPPLAMADMIAGLYGAMAAVIAVRNVEVHGGQGQVVDARLLESIFSILGPEAAIHKLSHKVRQRVGS